MTLSDALLKWYDLNRRTLPWRGTRDPYRIWLSEIMLQQTRAETVERYYARFLDHYPTVRHLADAEEDAVLKLWEGLGYYSRARNLHNAAKLVCDQYRGIFPKTSKELQKLPGIGPYAANAIASIAYDECAPALDGNQARVLTRVLAHESPLRTPFDLETPALQLISRARPGDYNQALMDLGASICTPQNPSCEACPLYMFCTAQKNGDPESFPRKQPPIPKRETDLTILPVLSPKGFCIRKRPAKGLLGGLYEFPYAEGHPAAVKLISVLEGAGFTGVRIVRELPRSKHVFTHIIWRMKGYLLEADSAPDDYIQTTDLTSYAFSSALRVYRDIAEELCLCDDCHNDDLLV